MQQGGAIKKPKRKPSQKTLKELKEGEAIAHQMQQQGGAIKYHDAMHKYLHHKLSGRGGRLDSTLCREKMHQVMSRYHPSIFQSYLRGKVVTPPTVPHYEMGPKPKPSRSERRPTVLDAGGSLRAITHSENGYLQSFDSTFYNHVELV